MTANVHPTSNDLLTTAQDPGGATWTLEHLEECLACRVRLSRIREAAGLEPARSDSLQRIVQASTPLPDLLTSIVADSQDRTPQPNDIWRVGRSEALLVWVRKVFEDGAVDVVPLVLDVDLADQESVIVDAELTPLATETAAMVALRTHVHIDSFLNRVGSVDIRAAVNEVMTAVREGRRPSGVRVGPPIVDDDDQRLEYRQALRDLLGVLTPSVWLEAHESFDEDTDTATEQTPGQSPHGLDTIESHLDERLSGLQLREVEQQRVTVDGSVHLTSLRMITCLDTTVLIAILDGRDLSKFPEITAIAEACQELTHTEPIVDAVVVAIPVGDWQAVLFTRAHMRPAVELPGGTLKGPIATLEGYGLVDTVCKYFEGVVTAWEVTEPVSDRIGMSDLHQTAARHARASIEEITEAGKRAHQPAKQAGWQSLSDTFGEQVARFIVAIASDTSIEDAMTELGLETLDD